MRLRASLKHLHCHPSHLPEGFPLADLDEIIAMDILENEEAARLQGGGRGKPPRGMISR